MTVVPFPTPDDRDSRERRRVASAQAGYTQIPNGLWLHPELTMQETVLLGWMASHDPAFLRNMSMNEIRRRLGGSSSIVIALQHLVELGFLDVSASGRRNQHSYSLSKARWNSLFGKRQLSPRRRRETTDPNLGTVTDPNLGSLTIPAAGTASDTSSDQRPIRKSAHKEDQSFQENHQNTEASGSGPTLDPLLDRCPEWADLPDAHSRAVELVEAFNRWSMKTFGALGTVEPHETVATIEKFVNAGYTREALREVLKTRRTFTLKSIEFGLREWTHEHRGVEPRREFVDLDPEEYERMVDEVTAATQAWRDAPTRGLPRPGPRSRGQNTANNEPTERRRQEASSGQGSSDALSPGP